MVKPSKVWGKTVTVPPYPSRVGQKGIGGTQGCQAAHIASGHDTPEQARPGSGHTPGLEGFELCRNLSAGALGAR